MNTHVLQSLLAGWLSGAAAGLALTAVVLVWLARRPEVARRLPLQTRLPILGIVAANALVFGLTLLGLVSGAVYHNTSADAGGGRFPLVLAGLLLTVGALYAFVRGTVRSKEAPVVLAALIVCGLAFGGLMPWLAGIET